MLTPQKQNKSFQSQFLSFGFTVTRFQLISVFFDFVDSLRQYKCLIFYCPYKRVGNQRAIFGKIIIKTRPITCSTINCIIP